MLTEVKKVSYCQKNNFERFKDLIEHLVVKIQLCHYRVGINPNALTYRGNGRIWGDKNHAINLDHLLNKGVTRDEAETNLVVIHRQMSVNRINLELTKLLTNFVSFELDPLDNSKRMDTFSKFTFYCMTKHAMHWIQIKVI